MYSPKRVTIQTEDGRTFTGALVEDTPDSPTQADGIRAAGTFLRDYASLIGDDARGRGREVANVLVRMLYAMIPGGKSGSQYDIALKTAYRTLRSAGARGLSARLTHQHTEAPTLNEA